MRCLLYVVLLVFITACSTSAPVRALDEAEEMMQSNPSAALSKLNEVDVSEFQDSATMARWALLYTEALAVNRLSAPTDTIVNIAIDYYGRHNLADEFKKASRLKTQIKASYESDALATALYLQKEKEFLLYKERSQRGLYTFGSMVVLLVAAGVIIWMRQRMKIQRMQNETLMAEASGLEGQIEASRGDVSRLQTKLHGLLDKRFSLIDSLCQTYYEFQGTKSERKAIIDKVKNEIESVGTDSFPEMEQAVNDCRDNILVKIKEINHDIKREDYMLLVYLASGLSTRTISLLLGESVEVIYKRKSRLKSRLRESVGGENPDVMAIF